MKQWVYERHVNYIDNPQRDPEGSQVSLFRIIRNTRWFIDARGAGVSVRDFEVSDIRGGAIKALTLPEVQDIKTGSHVRKNHDR